MLDKIKYFLDTRPDGFWKIVNFLYNKNDIQSRFKIRIVDYLWFQFDFTHMTTEQIHFVLHSVINAADFKNYWVF